MTAAAISHSPSSTAGEVWRLAWPAIAHMLLVTLVFMADRALVGHYASASLASMQISTTLMWSAVSLFGAVGVGATALVSRLVGEGDREGAVIATRVALLLGLVVGLVVAVPILVGNGALLRMIFPRVSAEVLAEASAYLAIVLPILPLALVESVAAACLYAAGDSRTPLRAAALCNIVNLALSGTLVFGAWGLPAMGVRGAALGSAVALSLQAVLLVRALPIAMNWRTVGWRCIAHHVAMARRLVAVALPTLGERIAYHGGYLAYVAIIAMLGATAMAANQALISIEAFSYQTAEGFGVAAAALVGQRLGAGRVRDAASACVTAVCLAAIALTGFSLLFVAAPDALVGLFSADAAVSSTSAKALYVAAAAQPIMAVAVVASMALRGAGATRTVLWVTLVSSVVVRLAATWLFAITLDMGLLGVWIGSTIDWVVHAALITWVFLAGRWRKATV